MPDPSDAASPSLQSERLGVAQATRVLDDARAERRQRLFRLFFTHAPGTRRQKMSAGYRLLDEVTDPEENALLRTMLHRCQSILDATTEPSG
jgi:hypothetical protein